MHVTMRNLEQLSLAEVEEFVEGNWKVHLSTEERGEACGFIEALKRTSIGS